MSHPCPDDPTPDHPGKHQQNVLPASGVVVFTIQSDRELCTGDYFPETFEFDSWGERIDGEDDPPLEHLADAIFYVSCGRHRDPTVGVWLNEDGTVPPPPQEAG